MNEESNFNQELKNYTNNINLMNAKYNRLAFLGMLLGGFAIVSCITIVPGVLLGIVAITIGVICKINCEKFTTHSILAVVFGVIALFLSGVIFLGTLSMLQDPQMMELLSEMMSAYYGQ